MQKIFTIFLSLLVASSMLSGCAYEANDEKTSEDVEAALIRKSTHRKKKKIKKKIKRRKVETIK